MSLITPAALAKSKSLAREIIADIENADPSQVPKLLDGLTKRELNTLIKETHAIELAKMSAVRPPPWNYKNPMPPLTSSMRLAEQAKADMHEATASNAQTQKRYKKYTDMDMTKATAQFRRADYKKFAIKNLKDYFLKKRMTVIPVAGKLYRSKKNKKNKSKRRHKKNIRKTRKTRRRM